MNFRIIHLGTLAIVTAIVTATTWGGAAAAAEPAAPVDCTNASAQLMAMKMPQIAATGNLDHDYMMMADADAKLAMKMAHIEMACGKNDAARKAAQAAITRNEEISQEISNAIHVPI